ncbi:macrolide ABC transporter ATP-binding protein [Ornatilinea apprima]|uniref:Macrolide ABC transporter ATP-binding protein n=1 Tax=Ornatilinea apprima TaxID=1134406 RepID=A0A0P6XM08_9CHLR|nr:macrolide ABC transporter ATP-binding protein [Ornatilinea apprima]
MNPIIETVEIKKIYGMGDVQVAALDGLSIRILPGEFVAIMGPSGSGKSTLMNILACLDHPSEGQYYLDGKDVSGLSRRELAEIRNQKLGFVFQSYNLLPRLSALENVILPIMYQHHSSMPPEERLERGKAALDVVGLANRAHHLPKELSGGQQQRVAIARALINDPVLILADEPTGNLDSKSSVEIIDLLNGLNERGRTIVMVTHEPDIASYTKRILHIRDGKLEFDHLNGHSRSKLTKEAGAGSQAGAPKTELLGGEA